jgi:hypothetical protein
MEFSMSELSLIYMSHTSIHISIPTPCHESWDGMDATSQGAFCHSCQKAVIDYSAMTDREVIEHLTQAKSGCGRFRADQVAAPLTIPKVNNGFMKWKALFLGLLPIFAARTIIASPHTPVLTDQKPTDQKDTAQAKPSLPEHITITGTIENEKGVAVPESTIQVIDSAGNFIGPAVTADKKGRFSIQTDRSLYKDALPYLRIYSRNYDMKIVNLTNEPQQRYTVKLEQQQYIVGQWFF